MNLKRRLFYLLRGAFHFGLPTRIRLQELFRRAANVGFVFSGDRVDIMWLCAQLTAEAKSGRVILWGRPTEIWGRHFTGWGPHEPIPEAHWHKHAIDWVTFTKFNEKGGIEAFSEHNAAYSTMPTPPSQSHEGRYWDLLIYDAHASAFINEAWAARPKGIGVPIPKEGK